MKSLLIQFFENLIPIKLNIFIEKVFVERKKNQILL